MNINDVIRSKANIGEIATELLPSLYQDGPHLKCRCPVHNEKTPSFFVTPSKRMFKCFGCGTSGDVIDLVAVVKNISRKEAIQWLKKRLDIDNQESVSIQVTKKISRKIARRNLTITYTKFVELSKATDSKVAEIIKSLAKTKDISIDSLMHNALGFYISIDILNYEVTSKSSPDQLSKACVALESIVKQVTIFKNIQRR